MNEYVVSREAAAATRVQSLWKGLRARRQRLVRLKAREKESAAARIQSLFRNRQRRKQLPVTRLAAEQDPFGKPTDALRMQKHEEQIMAHRRQYHRAMHSFMSEEQLRGTAEEKYA